MEEIRGNHQLIGLIIRTEMCAMAKDIYHIYAENTEGIGVPLETDDIMAGTLGKGLKDQHPC